MLARSGEREKLRTTSRLNETHRTLPGQACEAKG
jgi:hypothetical protein